MTNLEITRLCAEAIGYVSCIGGLQARGDGQELYWRTPRGEMQKHHYDPLLNDAQAMVLMKKFHIQPQFIGAGNEGLWTTHGHGVPTVGSHNLNRALCECVAQLQAAKERK